ncbi:MAG TPA: hypothetical protein VGZ73_31765 [Bryobacteraceae bacterium]|jgi:hypothetical protein|nr:hypothetical protein [Bryobacteraceae bacterium]
MKITISATKAELKRLVLDSISGEIETDLVGEVEGKCVKVNQEIPPKPPKKKKKKALAKKGPAVEP